MKSEDFKPEDLIEAFAARIATQPSAPEEAISDDLTPDAAPPWQDLPLKLLRRPEPKEGPVEERRQNPAQRLAELRRRALERTGGPLEHEEQPTGDLENVPLDLLRADPRFINSRQVDDPTHTSWSSSEGQTMEALKASMRLEGQITPIHVFPDRGSGTLLVRAGFRRWRAARELGWRELAAIILPRNTPLKDQHWINILENSARKLLTTYEVACSARFMMSEFDVSPAEYAGRAGYSVSHVQNLLRCLNKLPPDLIEQWKGGARLSLEEWCRLAVLGHDNARRYFRRWTGQRPTKDLRSAIMETAQHGKTPGKAIPPWLAARCRKIYETIEGSPLPPRERDLALAVVELCIGTRSSIPGVYEPRLSAAWSRRADIRRALAGKKGTEEQGQGSISQDD